MHYKSPVQNHSILNLTPLIDIVFLLLVFFMLTAHFVEEQFIELDLPQAATGHTKSEIKRHKISIDRTGIFLLNGEAVHSNVLSFRIKELIDDSSETVFQLEADKETSFEKVVFLLDITRQLNITQLEIITEPL